MRIVIVSVLLSVFLSTAVVLKTVKYAYCEVTHPDLPSFDCMFTPFSTLRALDKKQINCTNGKP